MKRRRSSKTKETVVRKDLHLEKSKRNPIIAPRQENFWESWQTFNPAALLEAGKVHLLYRALGEDGVSRVGYATSPDGIYIDERFSFPIFEWKRYPVRRAGDSYYSSQYISGGGCGGCEDPRITKIDDKVYMLFVAFDGYQAPRIAITSISIKDFLERHWDWSESKFISPPGIVDKSGCILPEKVNGKYVIFHRVFPDILVDFVDSLDFKEGEYLKGQYRIRVRKEHWDSRKIGAGAPPIKTKYGWLLIYYGVDDRNASQYKIGAMLLDLKDPTKVLHRTNQPILEPVEWYENRGHKAGVAYPCGAVVIDDQLFVYYGGADTVVCVATADLEKFISALREDKEPKLQRLSLTKK